MKKQYILILSLIWGLQTSIFAQSPLCASTATSFCCEYVSSVTINGQTSAGASDFTNGPGYFDYTSTPLSTLTAGNTYPVAVNVETNSNYNEYVKIWFDWNGNGDLSDAGELVYDQNLAFNGSHTFSGNITVPANAYNGDIYIRVVMTYANSPTLCGNYSYGNTFDFRSSITGGVSSNNLAVALTSTAGGTGNVVSSPTGIDTSVGNNSANYTANSVVTLTATPSNASSFFINWSGDASGTTNPLPVTLDSSKNITANFGSDSPPTAVCSNYTVQLDGSGNATITTANVDGGSSDPDGPVTLSISPSTFDCSDVGTCLVLKYGYRLKNDLRCF